MNTTNVFFRPPEGQTHQLTAGRCCAGFRIVKKEKKKKKHRLPQWVLLLAPWWSLSYINMTEHFDFSCSLYFFIHELSHKASRSCNGVSLLKSRINNLPYSLISAFPYLPGLPPSPASTHAPPPTAGEHGVSLLCCFPGHVSVWKLAPVSEQRTATRHTNSPLGAGLHPQWP